MTSLHFAISSISKPSYGTNFRSEVSAGKSSPTESIEKVNNVIPDRKCLTEPVSASRRVGLLQLWASYQIRKIVGCACAGNAGNVFPAIAS